jgi:ABC-type Fe3+ transport system permease subunit
LAALAAVAVAVPALTVAWTRRARRQGTAHPPTAEEENDPVDPRSRGLRLSATAVLVVLTVLMVVALLAFTVTRIADLLA